MKNVHRLSLMVLTVLTAVFLAVDLPLMAQRAPQQKGAQQGAPRGAGTAQFDKSSPKLTPQQQQRVQQLQKQQQTLQQNLQRVQGECRRVQADVQGVLANAEKQGYLGGFTGRGIVAGGTKDKDDTGTQSLRGDHPGNRHRLAAGALNADNLCEQVRGSVTVNYQTLTQHARSLANPTPSVPNVPTISEESGGKREDMFVTTQSGSVMVVDAGSGNVKTGLANVDMQNLITRFEEIKVTVTGLANQEQQISGQLQQMGKELEALGVISAPVSIPGH